MQQQASNTHPCTSLSISLNTLAVLFLL
eukprot:SAG11_NODE_14958_length_593_cov_1.425101_2_plen_27_part_01